MKSSMQRSLCGAGAGPLGKCPICVEEQQREALLSPSCGRSAREPGSGGGGSRQGDALPRQLEYCPAVSAEVLGLHPRRTYVFVE